MKIFLGALAYILPTFPYAYIWHLKIFKKKYEEWDYFGGNPSPPIGLVAILIQGAVLSVAYSLLPFNQTSVGSGLTFAGIMGVYHWTTHVIAPMAKHIATRTSGFFWMETAYLIGQFAVFGVLISKVYAW
jgi:hypothetical protein